MSDAVRVCLSKYGVWQGRAGRAEYWWFALAYWLTLFVALLLDLALNSPVLVILVFLAGFLPTLSVTVRRLHDTGRSGGWYWIALVPFAGGIILLVFLASRGERGPNQYGASPDGATSQAFAVSNGWSTPSSAEQRACVTPGCAANGAQTNSQFCTRCGSATQEQMARR